MNKLAIVAIIAASAATFGVAGTLAAQNDDFTKADQNQDKTVTMEEAMGVYPTLTQILFDQADTNKDGKLDEAEFAALTGLAGSVGNGSQMQDQTQGSASGSQDQTLPSESSGSQDQTLPSGAGGSSN